MIRKQVKPETDGRRRSTWHILLAMLATALIASQLAGGIVSASAQTDECVVAASSLRQAKADYANTCSEPRVDCDKLDATWYCSDRVIGNAAPGGAEGPASTIDVSTPPTEPPPTSETPTEDDGACTASAESLNQAKANYANTCTAPRVDCDPIDGLWVCSGEVIGANAPTVAEPATPVTPPTTDTPDTTVAPTTVTPTTVTPTSVTPTTVTPTTVSPPTCAANTSGEASLSTDLISLHYDHAPDRDDGHATAAGKQVSDVIGFTPWVIGGAYGADNANTYRDSSEVVMDAVWGPGNWINADADWDRAIRVTANRWQQTLENCGDIWIAEGGQSDLSADIVRELKQRLSGLDSPSRIHLVQHSNWNEEQALNADLAYVRANTDYIRIPDGNGGGNGTAGFNDRNYSGPFIDAALASANAAGWAAAFDYYSPSDRLDFSDTVELMEILDIGTNEVNDIDDFIDRFFPNAPAPTTTTTTAAPTDPLPDGLHPDIVKVIEVDGRNPGGSGWADSYSVGDACYCVTTFDHNIGGIVVDTPDGPKTVKEVCDTIGSGPGVEGRPIYNDVQCGNGPPNDAGDEDDCPGRVDIGRQGCGQIGPKWNLSVFRN